MTEQSAVLRVGERYRVTIPGGYRAPDGSRWASKPFDGGEPCPPRVVEGRVRRSYESVTGETCYVIGTRPRTQDTVTVMASEVIEVVPC